MKNDEKIASSNAIAFLKALVRTHGLKHAVYFAHTLPGHSYTDSILWTTYDQDWIKHYEAKNYYKIDPVIAADRKTVLPIDWRDLDRTSTQLVKRLFGEAMEFGIGKQGLTIPVRGPLGDRSLFIITSDENDSDWNSTKRRIIRDVVLIAQHVHHNAMVDAGIYKDLNSGDNKLSFSPREKECLRWAASGKTAEDISVILGISERVVRSYLDTARHKLNAINLAHAVARAVSYGIIAAD